MVSLWKCRSSLGIKVASLGSKGWPRYRYRYTDTESFIQLSKSVQYKLHWSHTADNIKINSLEKR